MSDRSSRLRIGTLDSIFSLPPRWTRKVRSLTLPISTPSTERIASTISSACAVSRAAAVTSTRSRDAPDAVTSRPVTSPPLRSIAVVSSLTAVARAGSWRRTVIELETEGAAVIAAIFATTGRYADSVPWRARRRAWSTARGSAAGMPHGTLAGHRANGDDHRGEGDAEPQLEAVARPTHHEQQHGCDEGDRQVGQRREGPHADRRLLALGVQAATHHQLGARDDEVDEQRDRTGGGEQVAEDLLRQHVVADHPEEPDERARDDRPGRHPPAGRGRPRLRRVAARRQRERHPGRGVERRVEAGRDRGEDHDVEHWRGPGDAHLLEGELVGALVGQALGAPDDQADHDEDGAEVEEADPP